MSDLILLKRSAVAGSKPTSLAFGEIALNFSDGLIYYKNSLGAIVATGSSGGTSSGGTDGGVYSGIDPLGTPAGLATGHGSSQISLSWTAPAADGGSAITNYTVQYSSNSGAAWTTFTHSASPAASMLVTGLTNGTAYVFRVAAVNAAGTGGYTATSAAITPTAAVVPKLTIARSNGTSTFGGGTFGSAFSRIEAVLNSNADSLENYSWTATAVGTAHVGLTYYDSGWGSGTYAFVYKNGGMVHVNYITPGNVSMSFPVTAGDVITMGSMGSTLSGFSDVLVLAE